MADREHKYAPVLTIAFLIIFGVSIIAVVYLAMTA